VKLIVEQRDGQVFVYRETEAHHRRVEPQRKGRSERLDPKLLDHDCNISDLGDFHMVFPLKR
jgi:hypothetical protein